jgi:hypothetical protein
MSFAKSTGPSRVMSATGMGAAGAEAERRAAMAEAVKNGSGRFMV